MSDLPLILYIPGLLPKPEAAVHRRELLRCLLTALGRVDSEVAAEIRESESSFDLVSWTYDFYREHRDIGLDLPNIESALAKAAPDEQDVLDATRLKRRFTVSVYRAGDLLPFLIPKLANERLEIHLRDMRRYATNENDIADHIRRLLKVPIEAAAAAGRPVLLMAHSMGSVIAWDALWQMSRQDGRDAQVSLWLTMGSPLGGSFVQRQLLGRDASGAERYPGNIDSWCNIAAVGELTAFRRELAPHFGEMVDLGLVSAIDDQEIFSFFRMDGALNVHNEYGYLLHEVTAKKVAQWWRSAKSARP